MRVLVAWQSKRGGTEGIGQLIAQTLEARGHEVEAAPADHVDGLDGFDAVILGGALYANRWPRPLRRFVARNVEALRRVPVWFFSSGPLDDSADGGVIAPPREVRVLLERVGAKGHQTFGGRLDPDAKGFPYSAMAKTMSGDFRNTDQIRAWADQLAGELEHARPGEPIDHPARLPGRLLTHAILGWALCAATMMLLLNTVSTTAALVVHAIAAPLFFASIAHHYFRAPGARDPLPTAAVFVGVVIALDLALVSGAARQGLGMFASFAGTWLPFALIFATTWATGEMMAMIPDREAAAKPGKATSKAHADAT